MRNSSYVLKVDEEKLLLCLLKRSLIGEKAGSGAEERGSLIEDKSCVAIFMLLFFMTWYFLSTLSRTFFSG